MGVIGVNGLLAGLPGLGLRQHTTTAAIDRQNAGSPTCIDLTIMDSDKRPPYDPALAGLYSQDQGSWE